MVSAMPHSFRLTSLVVAGVLAVSSSAFAEEAKKDAADPSVKLASVGIPVFTGHTIDNYLFLSIKINLTPKGDETKLRDKEPYFRDALVRAAHKTSFAMPGHSDKLDEARFKAVMMQEWAPIAGPGAIASIEIVSQSPKNH